MRQASHPIERMRLFNQFLRRSVAQRAVQRLVNAGKRVKQDIVRDHEGVLRSLRLLSNQDSPTTVMASDLLKPTNS